MPDKAHKPVILLAFANDQDTNAGYLRNLSYEARHLRETLEQAQASGLCEVVLRENATWDDIRQVFHAPQYRNRIALFHYGGHANGYQLLLETAEGKTAAAHAVGLAAFFGQQRELEVVFLNGCSTEPQVQNLLDEGISVVIATSQAIDDKVAAEFATCFYQSMATGSSLSTAFAEAVGAVKIPRGNETRHFYYVGMQPEATDRWPWALHLRPGSEEMAQWNLPAVVDNQLFGLPPLPTLDLPNSPYRYLDWYRREDAELFFGRGHAIRELYTSLTATDSAPITLFYGQSGVGKSSLLAAGLLPRLEQSHTLAYLRRDQAKGLLGTLTSPPSPLCSTEQRLDWQGVELRTGRPLLVVLDQVEEFRTRPNSALPQEMEQLLEALQEVFGDPAQRPQGKLLLSFRKEWLAEIEKQLAEVKLPHAKVFLKRLDRRGIIDVVLGPTRVERLQNQYGLTVEEGLAELIADDLLADQEAAVAPTLQILLTKLWTQATAKSYGPPVFSRELYDQVRDEGLGLGDFLDQQLVALRQIATAAVDSGLSLDLLVFHTTDQGTAGQHTMAELFDAYRHQKVVLPGLVHQCKALYLLTEPDQGGPGSEPMTRLAHDTLAPLVRARYEISDAPGQRARRILESRIVHTNGGEESEPSPEPLAEVDLALVEAGVAGMRAWDKAEQKLVELSRKNRERLRRQSRLRQRTFVVLALAIIGALGLALLQRVRTLARESELAVVEARQLASEASQLLDVDPVESIYWSLATLPEPAEARPYVPEAEFALYQALHSSLEQSYINVSVPPLNADSKSVPAMREEHVSFGNAQIAVKNNGLRIIPYDLSESGIITFTEFLTDVSGAEWSDDKDALLAWNKKNIQIWMGPGQSSKPGFSDGGTVTCAKRRASTSLIAICRGTALWLWSYETGMLQNIHTFPADIKDTRWSRDGDRLAVWDIQNTLAISDSDRILPLEIPLGARIHDVAWAEDGHHLVAAFEDATALIWSMDSLEEVHTIQLEDRTLRQEYQVEFVDSDRFLTWIRGPEHQAQLWSIDQLGPVDGESMPPIRTFGRKSDNLYDVKLSPDHLQLLTLLENGVIRGWNLDTGELLFNLQGHTSNILSIDWHERYPYLASSSLDGTARVWNTETGEELVTLRGHTSTGTAPGLRNDVWVHWHKDGRKVFTYGEDSTIRLWKVLDNQDYPICEGMDHCYGFTQVLPVPKADAKIATATWLTRSTILAGDTSGNALHWQLSDSEDESPGEIVEPASQPGQSSMVEWSPSGDWVFRWQRRAGDGTLWDFSTKGFIPVPGPIAYARWLDVGLLVAQDSGHAMLFIMRGGLPAQLSLAAGHETAITAAQAHDGLVATGDQDGVIWISDYRGFDHKEYSSPFTLTVGAPSETKLPIVNFEWSPNGKHLLSMDSGGTEKVTLWDVEKRTVLKEWPNLRAAAFSPDGQYVALASERSFLVYDIQANRESPPVLAHRDLIDGIQWVEGNEWPNQDIWGPTIGGLLRWLERKPWSLPSTRWLLLTGGGDGTVRFWKWSDIETSPVEIARLSISGEIESYALNEDASRLLTVDDEGVLRVWRIWLSPPEGLRQVALESVHHRTNK